MMALLLVSLFIPGVFGADISDDVIVFESCESGVLDDSTRWSVSGSVSCSGGVTYGSESYSIAISGSDSSLGSNNLTEILGVSGIYGLDFYLYLDESHIGDYPQLMLSKFDGTNIYYVNSDYPSDNSWGEFKFPGAWADTGVDSDAGRGDFKGDWMRLLYVIDNDNTNASFRLGTNGSADGWGDESDDIRKIEFVSRDDDILYISDIRVWNYTVYGLNPVSDSVSPALLNFSIESFAAFNDSGVNKSVFYEFENITYRLNLSFNGSDYAGAVCSVVNGNDEAVFLDYNASSGLYESVPFFYEDSDNYSLEIFCFEDFDNIFYDPVENVSHGLNMSAYSDLCANGFQAYAADDPSFFGDYSAVVNDTRLRITVSSGVCEANCTAIYWVYKESGDRVYLATFDNIGFGLWNESDHLSYPASIPDYEYNEGVSSLSSGVWHRVRVEQFNNVTQRVFVDGVNLWNNTLGGSSAEDFEVTLGGECADNDNHGYWDYFRVGYSADLVGKMVNSSGSMEILNIPPSVTLLNVNNSNGKFPVSPGAVYEYDPGLWQFNVSVLDDDLVNFTYWVYNSSGLIVTDSSYSFGLPSISGAHFTDFGGNPFNISYRAIDKNGAAGFASFLFNVTDSVFPVCYGFDNENVTNNTFHVFDVDCYDENFFSFNLSCDNGFNFSVDGLNNQSYHLYNTSLILEDTVCSYNYCDGHTARELSRDFYVRKVNDSVIVEHGNYKNILKINSEADFRLIYDKKIDRVTYTLDFRKSKNEAIKRGNLRAYSFVYGTSGYSFEMPGDDYDGWIVDAGAGTWFDTEQRTDKDARTEINRFNRTHYEITIYTYYDVLEFESIGELNCQSGSFTLYSVPVSAGGGLDIREFSSVPESLFYIFLVLFWIILLVMTLLIKGAHGRTIGLLNIFQMVVGFVSGSAWISYNFLIGFPLIFVAVGFFVGLSIYER